MKDTFNEIINEFKQFPQVLAIVICGSRKAGTADIKSVCRLGET